MSENEALSNYWWKENKDNAHATLFSVIKFLDSHQGYIAEMNLRHMRLYGNVNTLGMSANTYSRLSLINGSTDKVTLNIVQNMCDTVTNKIAKNKPKPTFLTSGGNFGLKKKAKLLDKFVQGQFYAVDLYNKMPRSFLDAAVFGTGPIKLYRVGGEIFAERTFINELKIDQTEAIHGNPRNLYQVKPMPKEVLVKSYPKFKDKILACKRADQQNPVHDSLSNHIDVLEAWHLPAGKDSKDGRHVICIENATLIDEAYNRSYFPFVFLKWKPRLLGFLGQGLAEELTGIQVEINKILRTIQLAFHLMGAPGVYVRAGSVIKAHLNNDVGRIVEVDGEYPTFANQNPVAEQLFSHLDRLYARAFEIAGVSQLSAQSKKPGGLDSGKALREFNDIEAERFILIGQMYEQAFMDATKQLLDLGKEIAEEMGEYEVTVKGRKFIEKIKWSEVDMKEDEYVLQVFPTSSLAQTPSGRLQDVQELIQAGFIDKKNALKLLDYPDLESYTSLANASVEDIENMIEKMAEKGEYESPEPFQDLQAGIQMMQSAYLKYKNDNAPEENLELLRRWMSEANAMLNPPAPPTPEMPVMPAPMGMPMGAPTAAPMPAPQSALIPNAPGM